MDEVIGPDVVGFDGAWKTDVRAVPAAFAAASIPEIMVTRFALR
jgi:hypothetical protein